MDRSRSLTVGDQGVFFRYVHLPKGPPPRFKTGDLFVVVVVQPDDVYRCLPITGTGRIISKQGDTVFAEEAIKLTYAPRIRVGHILAQGLRLT